MYIPLPFKRSFFLMNYENNYKNYGNGATELRHAVRSTLPGPGFPYPGDLSPIDAHSI